MDAPTNPRAEDHIITCRGCAQKLRVPPDRSGQPGRCPTCGRPFPPVAGRAWPWRWVTRLAWACLAINLLGWALLYVGDAWAPATILLFGPRWALAVPPALLLIPAYLAGRRPLLIAAAALVVAVGPVMGFNVPWARLGPEPAGGPRLRVLTCNLHYGRDAGALENVVAEAAPDLVAVQEWHDRSAGPGPAWAGWHVHRERGLFLASRFPIRRAARLGDDSNREGGLAARYEVETPAGPVAVASLHLASPRNELAGAVGAGRSAAGPAANSALRARQSEAVAAALRDGTGPLLVVGDFNTPPESVVFRRAWGDLRDAFADAGWGWGYTFRNRPTRVRIDHVLVGGGGRAVDCWVGPDVGSPHRPVVADVAWPGGE